MCVCVCVRVCVCVCVHVCVHVHILQLYNVVRSYLVFVVSFGILYTSCEGGVRRRGERVKGLK